MPLEIASFISGLNINNPDGADVRSQGDDHLRLIKEVLKATFPNATRAFRFPSTRSLQTANFNIDDELDDCAIYPVNSSSGNITVTLPAIPHYDGYSVRIVKYDFSANYVIIDGGANNINNDATLSLFQTGQGVDCVWAQALGSWVAKIDAAIPKGSPLFTVNSSVPPGYILLDGRTIGNGTSGASNRANADCLGIYSMFWNSYPNDKCPVSSGRGGSAIADFEANKTLTLLDARGRTLFGKDNMGGTPALRITAANSGLDGTDLGAGGGAANIALTRANLPNQTISVNINDPGHDHFSPNIGTTSSETNNEGAQSAGRNGARTGTSTTNISANFNLNGNVTQELTKVLNPGLILNVCLKL